MSFRQCEFSHFTAQLQKQQSHVSTESLAQPQTPVQVVSPFNVPHVTLWTQHDKQFKHTSPAWRRNHVLTEVRISGTPDELVPV